MNIYITADTHYGHANIAGPSVSKWKSGYRDFESIEDMNRAIVDSINDHVKENDILYHLGDWSFGGRENIPLFRNQLRVKQIHVISGNHDKYLRDYRHLFTEIHELLHRRLNGRLFVMCHYAMRVWNKSHHGSLHLFGHSHHSLPEVGRSMDVGWCKYRRPLHIDEVIRTLESRPIHEVDHHNSECSE